MPHLPARIIIPYIMVGFIVSSLIFFYLFPYSLIPASWTENINHNQLLKSQTSRLNVRSMINMTYHDNQFFVFSDESPLVRLYLDVVRDTVCGLTLRNQEQSVVPGIQANKLPLNVGKRIKGEDWPSIGISMIGQKRLINIEWALRLVIANNVPGDFIECGVWRGGGSVFARAVLKALNIGDRNVWLADSFQGLPKARTKNDDDTWEQHHYLRVSLEEVQTNFRSFDLLDDHVYFCKGYFVDALPRCNVTQIAVLRMDGDMYESTMDQLFNLYTKIQLDGIIIVDDYNILACLRAIYDFRNWHNITEKITIIPGDNSGRYWIKKKMVDVQMYRYKSLLVSTKNSTQQ